jgi:hypothetical protein
MELIVPLYFLLKIGSNVGINIVLDLENYLS